MTCEQPIQSSPKAAFTLRATVLSNHGIPRPAGEDRARAALIGSVRVAREAWNSRQHIGVDSPWGKLDWYTLHSIRMNGPVLARSRHYPFLVGVDEAMGIGRGCAEVDGTAGDKRRLNGQGSKTFPIAR